MSKQSSQFILVTVCQEFCLCLGAPGCMRTSALSIIIVSPLFPSPFFFLKKKSQSYFYNSPVYFYLVIYFIYLFLAVLGFYCCTRAFPSCGQRGLLFVVVRGLLIVVASLAAEHGLQACSLQYLWPLGLVIVARGLSCSTACGIFRDQGSNPCPLHWQVDS